MLNVIFQSWNDKCCTYDRYISYFVYGSGLNNINFSNPPDIGAMLNAKTHKNNILY
jgi:hypothetical protein